LPPPLGGFAPAGSNPRPWPLRGRQRVPPGIPPTRSARLPPTAPGANLVRGGAALPPVLGRDAPSRTRPPQGTASPACGGSPRQFLQKAVRTGFLNAHSRAVNAPRSHAEGAGDGSVWGGPSEGVFEALSRGPAQPAILSSHRRASGRTEKPKTPPETAPRIDAWRMVAYVPRTGSGDQAESACRQKKRRGFSQGGRPLGAAVHRIAPGKWG